MARISESELEWLKADVPLVRLIEDAEIVLARRGKDYTACCPFHAEDTASLVVTPEKNLFHCFGCGAAGGPVDWVMKRNGVSFRHAVELLREGLPAVTESTVKRTTVRSLPPPVSFDADDQALLNQVVDYYHETLKQSPEALDYLRARGLVHGELVAKFRLGYANRTLGLRLPEKTRKAGAEMRARLERIGIYRESGHEHFNGSFVDVGVRLRSDPDAADPHLWRSTKCELSGRVCRKSAGNGTRRAHARRRLSSFRRWRRAPSTALSCWSSKRARECEPSLSYRSRYSRRWKGRVERGGASIPAFPHR